MRVDIGIAKPVAVLGLLRVSVSMNGGPAARLSPKQARATLARWACDHGRLGAKLPDPLRLSITAEAEAVLGDPADLMQAIDEAWRAGLAERKAAYRGHGGGMLG